MFYPGFFRFDKTKKHFSDLVEKKQETQIMGFSCSLGLFEDSGVSSLGGPEWNGSEIDLGTGSPWFEKNTSELVLEMENSWFNKNRDNGANTKYT